MIIRTIWNEPRPQGNRAPTWWDWLIVLLVICAATIEWFLKKDVIWLTVSMLVLLAIAFALPWRRVHPLHVVILAFGCTSIIQLFAFASGVDWTGLDTGIILLLLPYSLLRWGSGREVLIGLLVITLTLALALISESLPWAEMLGASLFLYFPAAIGASVRYRDSSQRRKLEQVRMLEREQLARELHDTVAHHVSVIAIQAQAGQAVAQSQSDAPNEALGVIEKSASQTLTEMRHLVRALRNDDQAELSPMASLESIKGLAKDVDSSIKVDVRFSGELSDLDPAIEATLFRISQEAITNAVRYAREAHLIKIEIDGRKDRVTVRIDDDGIGGTAISSEGMGLKGMAERVSLLGGNLKAGPSERGGWFIQAFLPKSGSAS